MRHRIPMDLQIQYVRIRANVAPARLWESVVRPDPETPSFFRVVEPDFARPGALVTWQGHGRSPPCTGRIVGFELGSRLVIVLEPDDELHRLVQMNLDIAPDSGGCVLTVIGDPLQECDSNPEETIMTFSMTAEELKRQLEAESEAGPISTADNAHDRSEVIELEPARVADNVPRDDEPGEALAEQPTSELESEAEVAAEPAMEAHAGAQANGADE